MVLIEKTFPATEGLWFEDEASQILIKSWPDRGRPLEIEYLNTRGFYSASIRNPEPGQRIRLATYSQGEMFSSPSRIRVSTGQPEEEILAQAHCALWLLTDPEDLHEQPKQEVQGISLTKGTSVVVPTATETSLGTFTAWRTGILRVGGSVSTDPSSLNFRLYSVLGVQERKVGDSGAIPHRTTSFEFPLRDATSGALSSYYPPVVHAGKLYKLTVEHPAGTNRAFDADVYIEPVNLV